MTMARIKEWLEEKKEEMYELATDNGAAGYYFWWSLPLVITGAILTVAYWLGHPELVLKKRCLDMIVKNYKK